MSSTTYGQQWLKHAIFVNEFNFSNLKSQTHHHFGNVNKMARRNAGQLPQPFWLAHGCGSGSAATGPARI